MKVVIKLCTGLNKYENQRNILFLLQKTADFVLLNVFVCRGLGAFLLYLLLIEIQDHSICLSCAFGRPCPCSNPGFDR